MMNEDTITQEMTLDQLMKILRLQSVAIGEHEKKIQMLIEQQDAMRSDLDALRGAVEELPAATLRAISEKVRNVGAN